MKEKFKLSEDQMKTMAFGEVKNLTENIQVRRVYGGWMYEYLKEKTVVFVSTNEMNYL